MRVVAFIIIIVLLFVYGFVNYHAGFKDGVEYACDEFEKQIEEEYKRRTGNDLH